MSFQDLNLSASILQSTIVLGYRQAFPIQIQAITKILAGKDVLGIAPTGSGKTACFVMPLLDILQNEKPRKQNPLKVLVLVPTRELAVQIEGVFHEFSIHLKREIKSLAVYGGIAAATQAKQTRGVEVLIATPGRLLDLYNLGAVHIDKIEHLVIDEADKLFQLGFEEEMKQIIRILPQKRQLIMFSATMNEKVADIKQKLNSTPFEIDIKKEPFDIEQIEQNAYLTTAERKGPLLRYLLKQEKVSKVLIFVSSQRTADNLVLKLNKHKIKTQSIHGSKAQSTRLQILEQFKNDAIPVLVATDLIGRGIHIEGLPLVINYELPRSPQDYVHRIGRTGRANEMGKAITLLTAEDLNHFKIIQKKMQQEVPIIETNDWDLLAK